MLAGLDDIRKDTWKGVRNLENRLGKGFLREQDSGKPAIDVNRTLPSKEQATVYNSKKERASTSQRGCSSENYCWNRKTQQLSFRKAIRIPTDKCW